jgi:hypothetical protein
MPFGQEASSWNEVASRIAAMGLEIVATEGAETLPDRVRVAHREIRPGPGMSRPAFKAALRTLEE